KQRRVRLARRGRELQRAVAPGRRAAHPLALQRAVRLALGLDAGVIEIEREHQLVAGARGGRLDDALASLDADVLVTARGGDEEAEGNLDPRVASEDSAIVGVGRGLGGLGGGAGAGFVAAGLGAGGLLA